MHDDSDMMMMMMISIVDVDVAPNTKAAPRQMLPKMLPIIRLRIGVQPEEPWCVVFGSCFLAVEGSC